MSRASGTPAKKPYQPPKLTIYGDIKQMTMSTGMMALKRDAATKFKTH
ncbi:MAG TPA: hypothetical protein VEI49_07145 [Terriglobales bacterium]|nr:hypothetical protein [Terriglobales bacterium]